MTDRELLELAAKAIEFKLKWYGDSPHRVYSSFNESFAWNPLEDDGDALRLAVKLRMDINLEGGRIPDTVFVSEHESGAHAREILKENDKYAATRRAIVRSAAEIGKAMEG